MDMNKILTAILVICSMNCFSQETWAPTGTAWYYDLNDIGETGYVKIESIKDSIVEGKQCKYLLVTKNVYEIPGQYVKQSIDSLITYQDNTRIYIYQRNQFILLYDFNPSIGDIWNTTSIWNVFNTWNTGYAQSDTIACPAGRVKVDSIKTITLNNKTLKAIYTSPHNNSAMNFEGIIVEGIGCLGYMFPVYTCNQHIDSSYPYSLRCYNSDSFSYSWSDKACNYLTSIKETKDESLASIFPNPSNGTFNVRINQERATYPVNLTVMSLSGIELFNQLISHDTDKLTFDNLNKGVYLLIIKGRNSLMYHSKIIIQ